MKKHILLVFYFALKTSKKIFLKKSKKYWQNEKGIVKYKTFHREQKSTLKSKQ